MPLEPRARVDAFLHWTDDVADQAEPLDPSLHPVAVGAVLNLMIDAAGAAGTYRTLRTIRSARPQSQAGTSGTPASGQSGGSCTSSAYSASSSIGSSPRKKRVVNSRQRSAGLISILS